MEPRTGVLVIGQTPDPHITSVCERLEDKGVETVLLNRRGEASGPTVLYSGDVQQVVIRDDDRAFRSNAFGTVWWRVKPTVPSEFGLPENKTGAFRWSEWRAVLRSLNSLMPKAQWVNPLNEHFLMARKPRQLKLASDVGLTVPDTAITNSANDALRLFEKHDRVIYKSVSSFIAPPDKIIFTNEISKEEILENELEISMAPGIFQEFLEKECELRVTVVGEKIFTVKVDSQSSEETSTDWRRSQRRDMYERGELNEETRAGLMRFHEQAGLTYGTYDFVRKPSGDEVFLECNPSGQWLWLDEELGLDITGAVVQVLSKLLRE